MADEEEFTEDLEFEEDLADADVDPDDLDEEDLVEEAFELDEDDDAVVLDEDAVEEEEEEEAPATPRRVVAAEDDDDEEDLVDPDDVEADLDTILKDRLVTAEEEAEEDEEEVEVDDRGDPVDRIQPKRPGEFVCQSCFLVKHPSQLADKKRQFCADCV